MEASWLRDEKHVAPECNEFTQERPRLRLDAV